MSKTEYYIVIVVGAILGAAAALVFGVIGWIISVLMLFLLGSIYGFMRAGNPLRDYPSALIWSIKHLKDMQ